MPQPVKIGKKERMNYSTIHEVAELPNLIQIQTESYNWFIHEGLKEVFSDISPIEDFAGNLALHFTDHKFNTEDEPPKFSQEECKERDATYSAPLKVGVRLINKETGEIKEQEVFMGEFPLMTEKGTFICNGAERVVVTQLVRSPGPYYKEVTAKDKVEAAKALDKPLTQREIEKLAEKEPADGMKHYSGQIIPNRGAWLEYEMDDNGVLYVRVDRTRKLPATTLLKALAKTGNEKIMDERRKNVGATVLKSLGVEKAKGEALTEEERALLDLLTPGVSPELGFGTDAEIEAVFGAEKRLSETLAKDTVKTYDDAIVEIFKKLRSGEMPNPENARRLFENLFFDPKRYDLAKVGRYKYNKKLGLSGRILGQTLAKDVIDPGTGEVLAAAGTAISREKAQEIENAGVFSVVLKAKADVAALDREEIELTVVGNRFVSIDKYLPGGRTAAETGLPQKVHYPTLITVIGLIERKAKNAGKKKLSDADLIEELQNFRAILSPKNMLADDIIATFSYLMGLPYGVGSDDDIDHLGNRRVRTVGELLQNQFRIGLARMERAVRERMTIQDVEVSTPQALMNIRPVTAAIKEFFGSSQLSQFMDQNNPLAELTHKRRLSALGPGGLNRKRAGFEVRDVHHTHYGRVCPIETPEGPNIGLITSLACYSKVNQYGLIETPYRKVNGGKVTDDVSYLTADQEDDLMVAQSNTPLTDGGKINTDMVYCRVRSDYPIVPPSQVDYMDVSPLQVISVSAALIPFLEHDDANRALMGCNMQRQGVPLLLADAPLVGTGIEHEVARDSGSTITAARPGKVIFASADMVAVEPENGPTDIYELVKYKRSNQDTCINQRPLVKTGETVKKGAILADGPAMKDGLLSLGRNLLVGFMSWEGYNYEDAILVSHKLVKEDVFTSVHLHEFSVDARNTKLGAEEITRDIPNIGAEALSHLDADGIIIPSTVVEPGDILVGKVTPKGEQQLTPEERLLKVIFGKKADDVVDASLRVPPGTSGKIIGTRVFVRKEKLTKAEEKARIKALEDDKNQKLEALKDQRKLGLEHNKEKFSKEAERKKEEEKLNAFYKRLEKRILEDYEREMEFSKQGDELAVTVNKSVKVFIASKRKLMVGDKLSGRHGNKGVVAKILPEEDMPFMPDGTPLDIVLSPLGIPSRMNVGQLFETMLGWAAHNLNYNAATPVFDGPTEEAVKDEVRKAKKALTAKGVPEKHLPDDFCRITLYDGRTGLPFDEKITIGYMYIMKLIHLVEDKVHSRSTGPYSLITRQPLGGKAQFGGQRFGEMEVWAIEGYGATYTLQEFLTVKSDDFAGRTKMYESIVRGEAPQQPGVPESFKVLVKELQALGLSVELLKDNKQQVVEEMTKASAASEVIDETKVS